MSAVRATARIQLHADFPFDAAAEQAPYYAGLGVSHLYLSPILTARAGSRHGYDVIDHRHVNPELGGEDGLRRLAARARSLGMGLVIDIVPNHMAVGADNPWWFDVLCWGRDSPFAAFFDIDWDVPDPALRGKVLAPFLGRGYGEVLAASELLLAFTAGRFEIRYFDHRFPVAPRDYAGLLGGPALADHVARFRAAAAEKRTQRRAAFDEAVRTLAADAAALPSIEAALRQHDPGAAGGRERLHALLERQHYRLAWWHTAHDEINWRRFFDLADYAGLRVESAAVFEAVHATMFRLYAEGLVDGVRVDHVDGLADPRGYCRALRARLATLSLQRPAAHRQAPWLIIEKILAPGERLQRDWRVDGTTGYAFMNDVNALLHDPAGAAPLAALWTQLTGRAGDFADEERRARRRIASDMLTADFNATTLALHRIARAEPATRDWTLAAIRRVLLELLVEFPVYRMYVDRRGRSPADAAIMARALAGAHDRCRPADRPLAGLIDRWLGGEAPAAVPDKIARDLRLRAITRFQQLSSPLAAKAVEDTAFYRHGRLLSRNEVGGDPGQFALDLEEFHAEGARRRRLFPRALLATATHDHKRGEDARARLAVLSHIAPRWREAVRDWFTRHAPLHQDTGEGPAPTPADEYMLYQTLVGHWPPQLRADDAAGLEALRERVEGWFCKAIREAKLRSSWVEPNLPYEEACATFLRRLLDPAASDGFPARLAAFVQEIASAGAANGLAQALLRMTAPGIPDLYQGTEYWDFSLVDPDNRRLVDYVARAHSLAENISRDSLVEHWRDGRLKQHLVARSLALRSQAPDLFTAGEYLPIQADGPAAVHVIAFARRHDSARALVIAARWNAGRVDSGAPRIAPGRWQGTALILPPGLRDRRWTEVVGDRVVHEPGARLDVARALDGLTVALLWSPGPR